MGVAGYGGGVIGRYIQDPDEFPNVQAFHTMRVNHPAGWFYKTDRLRELLDVWEKHGSGITYLSMGMSHNYHIAAEEGATMVRIGTGIFGPRNL